jgi:asparagine synthase (glutamine-hydrolysing)
VRVPFLEPRLVEFALALPPAWLVSPWPVEGKRLLRDVAGPLLPPRILNRPKHGFCVPLNDWLQRHLLPMFDALGGRGDARLGSFLDYHEILAMRQRPLGETPRGDLYALLVLELWLRRLPHAVGGSS